MWDLSLESGVIIESSGDCWFRAERYVESIGLIEFGLAGVSLDLKHLLHDFPGAIDY